jgi:hypothetical protein
MKRPQIHVTRIDPQAYLVHCTELGVEREPLSVPAGAEDVHDRAEELVRRLTEAKLKALNS